MPEAMGAAAVEVQVTTTCIGGWTRPVRGGFEVLCLGDKDSSGVRPSFLMRYRVKRDGAMSVEERVPIRGVASDLDPYTANIGRGGRFVLSARRPSDRTGEVFELTCGGVANRVLTLPQSIGPKYALPRDAADCRAWAGERPGSHDDVYDVYYARDAHDPGTRVYTSTLGVRVNDVDCARESVWVLEPRTWHAVEIDRSGAVLGEHPTGDLLPDTLWPVADAIVRGRCSVGVFGADLRVFCGHTEVGSLPIPTQITDLQVDLSDGLEEGGFIAVHASGDRHIQVHEVAPGGLVGDWLPIPIPEEDLVMLRGVVANRTHVCARWTVARQPHSPPEPVNLACLARPQSSPWSGSP